MKEEVRRKKEEGNGNARRELTFRKLMVRLRARKSLDAEEIQRLADTLSRLWREREMLYNNRISRARKMLDSMLDGEEPQVISTGDITSSENLEVISTGDITSPLAGGERREREKSPHTPLKEKGQETNNNNNARARGKLFTKPTVEEIAAYVKAKGYTFDAEQFWNYYESKGWLVGKAPMKSWQSACVTWQKRNGNGPRPLSAYERTRAEFEREAEAIAARKEASRRAAIAALTAKDWALCAERCANCRASGGCLAEIAVPPDHRLNARPCSPEECPRFAAKEGISPERSELRKQPLGGCAA